MLAIEKSLIQWALLFLGTLTWLQAGVVPGRWEKVEAQLPGASLAVTLASGETAQGFLVSTDSTSLTLMDPVQGRRSFPKSSVTRVTTAANVEDPVSNGVAVGAGVGLVLGLLNVRLSDGSAAAKTAGVLVQTGIGAGIGYLVDKSHDSPLVLYQARR